jgi:hypothetical protein
MPIQLGHGVKIGKHILSIKALPYKNTNLMVLFNVHTIKGNGLGFGLEKKYQ